MSQQINGSYEFGDFRFDARKRVLWRSGVMVPLAPKASEVLAVLLEEKGNLVERREMFERVWSDTLVEEGNLNHAISALRKVLGDDVIQTIPRRGYRFTGAVSESDQATSPDVFVERRIVSETRIEEHEEIEDRVRVAPRGHVRRHIALAVFAVLLVGAAASVSYFWSGSTSSLPVSKNGAIKTLAILPLRSLDDPDRDNAFGLGLTESLVSRLGSLEQLAIRPTKSVSRLAETYDDPVEVGRLLRSDVVMTGTFQRAGGRVRVSMRLLNVADGSQIWSGTFDEDESDLFRLQDSFTEQVIHSLALNLSAKEQLALSKRPSGNPDAYNLYLQGRELWNKRGNINVSKSIFYFERAIELDPDFALAYSGLADAQTMLNQVDLAEANIRKALTLDNSLAEAHASLGFIRLFNHFDWMTAEQALKRAVELNPNYATAHHWLGFYYSLHGRFEQALAALAIARELDPSSPILLADIGQVYYFMREYDKAIEYCNKAVELDPEARIAHEYLLYIHFKKGNEAAAFEENIKTERANTLNPNQFEGETRKAFAASGIRGIFQDRLDNGRRDLQRPVEKRMGPYPASEILKNSALLGKNEDALNHVGPAFEEGRKYHLLYLNVDPIYDEVRSDPRFQAVLRKMNFRE